MSKKERRPILYKGEVLAKPITKKGGGNTPEPQWTYEEARDKIIKDIDFTTEKLKSIPSAQRLPNEIVFCMRLNPQFTAKSYYPEKLFTGSQDIGWEDIGSRLWQEKKDGINKPGKLMFVRGTIAGLNKFKQKLNKRETEFDNKFTLDLRKLSSIDLLTNEEQILGFDAKWKSGMIEAVIHPFDLDKDLVLTHFKSVAEKAGLKQNQIKYKQYAGGITFVSLEADLDIVNKLSGYNPLRTIHPMASRDISKIMRFTTATGSPAPPIFTKKPEITLGILDGGLKTGNVSIDKYTEVENAVGGDPIDFCENHGTHVTSAALYGPLNYYKNSEQLPEPAISVKNFRIISTLTTHHELYESIDAIEKIVPTNPEIQVYNLSMGPRGPILDDSISRFTFACDLLSYKYNVLFCVAVGNDGDKKDYDRIQSPSDMVNGLAVGAFTLNGDVKERADYSCVGPGREGNKMKPDITAFGGCDKVPTHLLSGVPNTRTYTSCLSPL